MLWDVGRHMQARSAGDKSRQVAQPGLERKLTLRNFLIDTYRIVRTSSIISDANSETLMNYTGSFCTDVQFVSTVLKAKGNCSNTLSDDVFWLICSLFVCSNHTSKTEWYALQLLFGVWANLDLFIRMCLFPLLVNLKQLKVSSVYLLLWTHTQE